MDSNNARRIEAELADDALVIDVGGGMGAFPRADWIIDAIPFETRGKLLNEPAARTPHRFTKNTWVQFDICSHQRWPLADKQFDYAVCSHVLEDVRDPIWVCSEISRIAKAGYIEVPSRVVEQSTGIEHPRLAGYYHHRWLVSVREGELEFRQKPHLLHVTRDAIVTKVGFWRTIHPRHQITTFEWREVLPCREVLEFDEQRVVDELCQTARSARNLPDLWTRPSASIQQRFKRAYYHFRLQWM